MKKGFTLKEIKEKYFPNMVFCMRCGCPNTPKQIFTCLKCDKKLCWNCFRESHGCYDIGKVRS